MAITLREHAAAGLVAAAVVVAALLDGLFEPIAVAAACVLVWAAVIAGLVSRTLPISPVAGTAAVAGALLAAIMVLAGLSIAWASDQGRAFTETVRISAYVGLFTLAACTAASGGRRQWISGLALGLGGVGLIGLLSHLQPGLIGDESLDSMIPEAAGWLTYPIGYWNGMAALLAAGAVLLAHFSATAGERAARAVAGGGLALIVLAIWLTTSRGGVVAALVGLAALMAASPDRTRLVVRVAVAAVVGLALIAAAEQLDGLRAAAGDADRADDGDVMTLIAALGAAAAGAAVWALDSWAPRIKLSGGRRTAALTVLVLAVGAVVVAADPAERWTDFKTPPANAEAGATAVGVDLGSSGRWQFWGEAVDAFGEAPIAGIGAGAFEDHWARNATVPLFVRNPHSLPLQQASELGAIGVLLLIGFLAVVAVAAWRWLRWGPSSEAAPLVAVLASAAVGAAIDWTWAIPAVFGPAIVCAGLLTASAPGPPLRRYAYWTGLATLAIGWVSAVAAGLLTLGEVKLDQSREAAGSGDLALAEERADEARTVLPWSPEPYLQLALVAELRDEPEEAIERLRQAQERDPEDWRLPLIEARLLVGLDEPEAAQEAFLRAQDLNSVAPLAGPG